ncbi:MAG: FecR domain-containing protein, partial [Planctomycetota bacterium]
GIRVVAAHGNTVEPDGRSMALDVDDRIVLDAGARAAIRMPAGDRVVLPEAGELVYRGGTPCRFELRHGRADLHIDPNARPAGVRVSTPHLEATVLGTVFSVTSDGLGSSVSVQRGRVGVDDGHGHRFELDRGEAALVQADHGPPLRWRPDPTGRPVRAGGRWLLPHGQALHGVAVPVGEDPDRHRDLARAVRATGATAIQLLIDAPEFSDADRDALDRVVGARIEEEADPVQRWQEHVQMAVAPWLQADVHVVLHMQPASSLPPDHRWRAWWAEVGQAQLPNHRLAWQRLVDSYAHEPAVSFSLGFCLEDDVAEENGRAVHHDRARAWVVETVAELRGLAPAARLVPLRVGPEAHRAGLELAADLRLPHVAISADPDDAEELLDWRLSLPEGMPVLYRSPAARTPALAARFGPGQGWFALLDPAAEHVTEELQAWLD